MPILNCTLQGRFGNATMQWLFCRAVAEQTGAELRCDPWIGEQIFDIEVPRYSGPSLQRVNETGLLQWMLLPRDARHDIEFRGYAQMQSCMLYSKTQARRWLSHKLNPRWNSVVSAALAGRVVAHLRHGDFRGYSYPMISALAFERSCEYYRFSPNDIYYCREESPSWTELVPQELSFLPDFLTMMTAPALFRANSSFSWVAGLLSAGIVMSPRIDGLTGGIEHDDVCFEPGNHCKLSDHDFCSDLHVKP